MRYIQRPEAIESVFYLYRITGAKAFFKDTAWDMFTAINNGTRTDYANAAVLDVIVARYPLPKMDSMEASLVLTGLADRHGAANNESHNPPSELLAGQDIKVLLSRLLDARRHQFRRGRAEHGGTPFSHPRVEFSIPTFFIATQRDIQDHEKRGNKRGKSPSEIHQHLV